MDVLFNDYIENIVDKAYHRLLTSDNVSKFRPEIIERLESKSHSKAYVEKQVRNWLPFGKLRRKKQKNWSIIIFIRS